MISFIALMFRKAFPSQKSSYVPTCNFFPFQEQLKHIYRQASFYCASLYCTLQMLCFLQTEGKTLHQQKFMAHFIVIVALLWWSGTKPALSPRYACSVIQAKAKGSHKYGYICKNPNYSSLTQTREPDQIDACPVGQVTEISGTQWL